MPKTLLRMILNATLPRLIQRALLVALPQELGQYLLACRQGIHIAGATLASSCCHPRSLLSLINCYSTMPQKHHGMIVLHCSLLFSPCTSASCQLMTQDGSWLPFPYAGDETCLQGKQG